MAAQYGHHQCSKKKLKPTTRQSNGAVFMLRCTELNLSDDALAGMTVGMVYDLLAERANDHEDYPFLATQDDFDKF